MMEQLWEIRIISAGRYIVSFSKLKAECHGFTSISSQVYTALNSKLVGTITCLKLALPHLNNYLTQGQTSINLHMLFSQQISCDIIKGIFFCCLFKYTFFHFLNYSLFIHNTPQEHHRSSFKMCSCILGQIGIWQCLFLRSGENQRTWRKTCRSKERTNNKLYPQVMPGGGIKPGPHWWEAGILTTVPPLCPT